MLIMIPESCLGQGPEIRGQSNENPMASRVQALPVVQAPACGPGSSKAATAFVVSEAQRSLPGLLGTFPHLTSPPWVLFAPLCLWS